MMQPELSVVIPTLNGSDGIGRCLRALNAQRNRDRIEVIVVDDGSTDDTAAIAKAHGAQVISHPRNLGASAARSTGASAAHADIVAYIDDDCEAPPEWARTLLKLYADDIAGIGGPVVPQCRHWYLAGFLTRHNPIGPLELNLALSNSIAYRFYLYLRRMWFETQNAGTRDVFALASANMSIRKKILFDVGLFDERFHFGGEDTDLCMRVAEFGTPARLVFTPDAPVLHHFKPALRDTLRRSRIYGIGQSRLRRKWPSVPLLVFPVPLLILSLLIVGCWVPAALAAAVLLPLLLYPKGVMDAVSGRNPAALLDSYVQLAQESCANIGIAQGAWRFRSWGSTVPQQRNVNEG